MPADIGEAETVLRAEDLGQEEAESGDDHEQC